MPPQREMMEPFDMKDLRELVEFLKANDIAEFNLDRGEHHLHLKFASAFAATVPGHDFSQHHSYGAPAAVALPVAAPSAPILQTPSAEPAEHLHEVKSPIVGTYYESSAPGAPAFTKVGDTIEVGQVLCIVEAMKLMNEIESDVAGEVVRVIARNGQPVEYGQVLFTVRAR